MHPNAYGGTVIQGTIAELILDRSFGFIDGQAGRRYFFNRSALLGTEFGELAPGKPVQFEESREPHGDEPGEHPRAVSIRLTADAIAAVDNEALPPEKIGS